VAGGGGPQAFAQNAAIARDAWSELGRTDKPRLVAIGYYALGEGSEDAASSYLRDYYAFMGPRVDMMVKSAITSPEAVKRVAAAYEEAGCDELILFPCSPETAQVDLLGDAAGV
jgi:hypothetical protein